jgi:hypothetical protein
MTFTGQPETMRFQTAEFLGPVSDAPKYIQISYQVGCSIYIYIKLVTVYIYGTVKLYLLVSVPRESAGQFQ